MVPRAPSSPMQFTCALKGGLLNIATQELLPAVQPSPLALTTASRPGIPAAAELPRGPGPEDLEHIIERGEEGKAHTGLTWLHYGRWRTSLVQPKETTPDYQDKFRTRVSRAMRHSNPISCSPVAAMSPPFPIFR